MSWLSDRTLDHLRGVVDRPDLGEGSRYEVLDAIARGGMGTVWVARDRELERLVALKVLNATGSDDVLRERMVREARVLARLEHPGIVPVHDVGTLPDGRVFYTMKRVDGVRLDEHLSTATGLRERLRVFERICEAVAFAHSRGVLHRDLTPANVMVGAFGEALVMDWGLAKILDRDAPPAADTDPAPPVRVGESDETITQQGVTGHGTVLGTPGYMAPEQAAGRPDLVGRHSDVYSLGAILRDVVGTVDEPVPRRMRAVVQKATAAIPAERYADVESLARDVSRFLAGEPVSAYREGLLGTLGRFAYTYRTPLALLATYLVVRALVLIFAGT